MKFEPIVPAAEAASDPSSKEGCPRWLPLALIGSGLFYPLLGLAAYLLIA